MPNFKKIFRYMKHYGVRSTFGLAWEKTFIDKKRFSPDIARELPSFPEEYREAAPLPTDVGDKPLTILYLIHYFYPDKKGGTERFTLNLAKEQQRLGNKAYVLVLDANTAEYEYPLSHGDMLYREYEYDGIACIGFRHKNGKSPLGLYYKDVRVDDEVMSSFAGFILKEYSVDLIHATYPQPFASFLVRANSFGVPYVVTCTDFCMMCHYSTMVDKRGYFCGGARHGERCAEVCRTWGCHDFAERYAAANWILKNAALVTVPSRFVARVLSAEFPEVEFLPVAHGISDAFKFRVREGKPCRFVYAGTISPLKGIHLLLEAFKAITGDDLRLDIYGDGDENYKNRLIAMKDSRVTFHGAVSADEMPKIYSDADCVIVPSMWYETYNFVLREALATGALVIASDIGAMPEAVITGENGYLFKASDGNDLAEKMKMAVDFDFDLYHTGRLPTTSEEGELYNCCYQGIVNNKK